MAKTIGQLTAVTTFNPSTDEFVIEQSGQTFKVAASVVRGGLVNANIDGAAAIAGSKLADGGVTPVKLSQPFTLRTAQNSTSGTSIDFTAIPSWAKRVTVILSGVSTNGTSDLFVQLGTSAGITTSGYTAISNGLDQSGGTNGTFSNTAFPWFSRLATDVNSGTITFHNVSANTWVSNHCGLNNGLNACVGGGTVALASALTQLTISANGDTFDAGSINISYEG